MLATVMNGLFLQSTLEKKGKKTCLMSSIETKQVAETYIQKKAVRHLEKNRIVILSAGLGAPYFSTDTASVVKPKIVRSDMVIKGTKVDGVYDKTENTKTLKNFKCFKAMMEVAKDICLHIAANKVEFISGEEISDEILEKEKSFLMEQAKESGKPPEIIEKMIIGKLQKFKKEICLLDQPFLKNPDVSIAKLLADTTNQLGQKIAVKRFSKFAF